MRAKIVILLIPAAAAAGSVLAATQDLSWHTIDGGGTMVSAGGKFSVSGTIGQPDAGFVMSGGAFQLTGGFWAAMNAPAATGDCNADGLVDLADHATLSDCLNGPQASAEGVSCACFDFDGNGTVDLLDFAQFQVVRGDP